MSHLPEHHNIFIIIPAYNEHSIIKKVLEDLLPYNYTIVVVDDGSDIPVYQEIKDLGIHYLRHRVNLGQGAAIQTGIEYALQQGGQYIVTFDADGQHLASDIKAMIEPLVTGSAEITLASRFLQKGSHNASARKRMVLRGAQYVNYFFTGLYLSDAHNGLRAMTYETAKKIQLKENRMAHATEFLFIIRKQKLRFMEVSATVTYTLYSKNKGQSIFNSIRIFFDLVLHKLFE